MTNWHRGAARADVPGNNENGRESDARLSKCRGAASFRRAQCCICTAQDLVRSGLISGMTHCDNPASR